MTPFKKIQCVIIAFALGAQTSAFAHDSKCEYSLIEEQNYSFAGLDNDAAVDAALSELKRARLPIHDLNRLVAALAIRLGELEVEQILHDSRGKIQDLENEIEETSACGLDGACMMGRMNLAATKLNMLGQAVWRNVRSEGAAREALREAAARSAPPGYSLLPASESESVALDLNNAVANLDALDRHRVFTWKGFKGKVKEGASSFRFWELKSNPEAWANFWKSWGTVTAYQLFGQSMILLPQFTANTALSSSFKDWLNDPSSNEFANFMNNMSRESQWQIFMNTFLIMFAQEMSAAKNQSINRDEDQRAMATIEGLLGKIPTLIQGRQGYWTEGKNKIISFMGLFVYENVIMTLASYLRDGVNNGYGQALLNMPQVAAETSVSLLIFGSYLSVKWALLQKLVNLGILPQYRTGTRQVAEDALGDFVKARGVPQNLTLADFNQLQRRYSDRSGVIRKLRAGLRLWMARKGVRLPKAADLSASIAVSDPAAFDQALAREAFSSTEAQKVLTAYQKYRRGWAFEWLWRTGDSAFDAYAVFGLFGKVSPWIVNTAADYGSQLLTMLGLM